MPSVLRYGSQSQVTLDLPPAALVAECGLPRGEPLDDPAAAMAAALISPIDFPALGRCVVPGDRVTIALDAGLPQLPLLVAGLVETLLGAGIEPAHITILRTIADARAGTDDPRAALAPAAAEVVELVTHDPACRAELRYLGASATGKPIYLNRQVHEADFVLPVGCARLDSALGYHGVHGGLFPSFSDEQTLRRFWAPSSEESPDRRRRRRREAEEVAWLLGISFSVQVIPAALGQVLHILAGEANEVLRQSRKLCEHAWRHSVPRRANLVVAAIDGDQREQTWDNVARALSAASALVVDGGAIAICSDLADEPGPALKHLSAGEDSDSVRREVRRERTADAVPAAQLLRVLDRATVYLLSRLDEGLVEELGVAPVSDGSEIARLSGHYGSCILLSSAQYAVATPESE